MTARTPEGVDVLRLLDEVADCAYVPVSRDTLHEALLAVAALVEAGNRVTAAFRAYGEARSIAGDFACRRECETAMLALDAALSRMGPQQ